MKSLMVTAIQSDIYWEDKQRNMDSLKTKIRGLAEEQRIVFLPEMFATGFSMNTALAEPMDGETIDWMRDLAHAQKKIICGSVMIKDKDQILNRLIWMLPDGTLYHYDKRHLFAFAGEEKTFSSGQKKLMVQVNGWKISLLICYDLRFPVWCRQQDEPFDILAFVANWPEKRIQAWKTLLQARAIENQCYVIGVNRVGEDGNGIAHSGESMIVDPLGNVCQKALSAEEAILAHELNPDILQKVRDRFPFMKDRDKFRIL